MGWLQRLIGKDGTNAATTANGVPVHTGTEAEAGFLAIISEEDAGAISGSRLTRKISISDHNRLGVGIDTVQAFYNFTAITQNTGKFKHAFTTMTMTQSAGFLNINPALATVSGNYAYLQSWKHYTLQGDGALHIEITGQITAMPPANQIFEAGLFIGTAGTVPTDGAFFRLTNAGLIGVVAYNSVETTTSVMAASVPINTNGQYRIIITQRSVEFWIDDILGGVVAVPAANAVPYITLNLPLSFMMRNTNTVTGGSTVKIGTAHITQKDLHTTKNWSEQMGTQGNAYQGQDGDTQGSLAIYSNAALAAAAALTNTTAAAGNTGLGGVALVLPTLAAGTDGILFSYQNPVGSTTIPPKTLVVTGVTVSGAVQVALTGGPLVYIMGAAFGHTAVSLATAESGTFATGTTKSPRRVPLGTLSCVVTAAVSVSLGQVSVQFASPLVINPGEFFAITARNVATVTSAGAIAFVAQVDHYFE